MYTGDIENETQEKCLLGRKIILEDDRITGAALLPQGQEPPHPTAGRKPVSLTAAEIASP